MANQGKLRVTLTDVRERRIKEEADVILRHRTLTELRKVRLKPGAASTIADLHARPQGVYHVFIDPPSYQPVSQFIDVSSSGITTLDVVCGIDPRRSAVSRSLPSAISVTTRSGHSKRATPSSGSKGCPEPL